jgi:hypothetical protein
MYHDQGQIATKLLGFSQGVTLTGGLKTVYATPRTASHTTSSARARPIPAPWLRHFAWPWTTQWPASHALHPVSPRSSQHEQLLRPVQKAFKKSVIKTSGAEIVTTVGGSGPCCRCTAQSVHPPVRHKIAPRLAEEFTVVCTTARLRGQLKPKGGDAHVEYSFRAMAQDQVEVMQSLGFDQFHAAGHDRGARSCTACAWTMATRCARLPSPTCCRSTTS